MRRITLTLALLAASLLAALPALAAPATGGAHAAVTAYRLTGDRPPASGPITSQWIGNAQGQRISTVHDVQGELYLYVNTISAIQDTLHLRLNGHDISLSPATQKFSSGGTWQVHITWNGLFGAKYYGDALINSQVGKTFVTTKFKFVH